jgi:hypothetical protein
MMSMRSFLDSVRVDLTAFVTRQSEDLAGERRKQLAAVHELGDGASAREGQERLELR